MIRATVTQSDLPFTSRISDRIFPLKKPEACDPDTTDHLPNAKPAAETDKLYEDCAEQYAAYLIDLQSKPFSFPDMQVQEAVVSRLHKACPELVTQYNLSLDENESLARNIRIRHVQPIVGAPPDFSKNYALLAAEPQLKRSLPVLKKVIFEQTSRMFQKNLSGTVVYDVMNSAVTDNTKAEKGLVFDSRFESGNLQIAAKITSFEYDLLLQSDINAISGKHNMVTII